METKISLLAQTSLGPFSKKHTTIVATSSEKQIENPKESDNEVEKILDKKRIETLKTKSTSIQGPTQEYKIRGPWNSRK